MLKKILVIGKTGQVARNLAKILYENTIFLDRDILDLSKDNIENTLLKYDANIIINAAAYTQVDKAEDEIDLAYKVNAEAVNKMAKYAKNKNILLVHYSTDYVFSGKENKSISEDDVTNPLSIYGKSKLLGEENIKNSKCKYLIIRTSGVYDSEGTNFVRTMFKLALIREELDIVSDQITSPTYAFDLAKATIEIINNNGSGIYNITNNDSVSWYNFACKIFDLIKNKGYNVKINKVNPITIKDYPMRAIRPQYSILSNNKIYKNFKITMPHWNDALERCINLIGDIK